MNPTLPVDPAFGLDLRLSWVSPIPLALRVSPPALTLRPLRPIEVLAGCRAAGAQTIVRRHLPRLRRGAIGRPPTIGSARGAPGPQSARRRAREP